MVKSVQAGTGEVGLGKATGFVGTKLHVWFPSTSRLSVSTAPQTFEPALISSLLWVRKPRETLPAWLFAGLGGHFGATLELSLGSKQTASKVSCSVGL